MHWRNVMASGAMALSFSLAQPGFALEAAPQVANYARLVYANYADVYADAVVLQQAVEAFLQTPTEATLAAAKAAWLKSRDSYGQSEAFRFYEGPIDFVDSVSGTEGPEGRLNSWPLNEAYIDYVVGNANSGIVQHATAPITAEMLAEMNQADDEADVSTGYHAIEFLLWGQDMSLDGPGTRPVSDYVGEDASVQRRREYLQAVTNLLVQDAGFLKDSWEEGQDNYRKRFLAQDTETSVRQMLTALATLSGFELAAERMATALDSGDQEDEHSCFSDNTHNDFIMNARGIRNVYLGEYGTVDGPSLYDLLKEKDAVLAETLATQLATTQTLVESLPHPVDREILASEPGSKGRQQMESVIASLQAQADLFVQAGKVLGLDVHIASE